MIKQTIHQGVTGHWRSLLLASASLVLSACVAEPTPSSSSAAQSSEQAMSSSSLAAVSSSESSSSEVASSESSVVVISSSSIAPSSSSMISSSSFSNSEVSSSSIAMSSSSAADCEELDQARFDHGDSVYNADCSGCHGATTSEGKTVGGGIAALPAINVEDAPYGKTNNPLLAGYILSGMSNHFKSCTNSNAECAEDIAYYLEVATNVRDIADSCGESSSSVSSSSMSSVQSSSSSSAAPEPVLIGCDVPTAGHNLYGSGFEVNKVVVTNTTGEALEKWTATLTFPATINQLYNRPQGELNTSISGGVVKVTGTNLAAGATVSMNFGGNYGNGESSTNLPTCVAEKFIPAPVVPLEPDQTGPLANGYCPLNSGLGVGSTSQHEIFVVTDDGGVAKIHEGKADFIDGVNNAIAVSAGSYSSDICYALTSGNVQCGKYQSTGSGSNVVLVEGLGKVIESVTTDIGANVCFLNDAGEAFCGSNGGNAAKVDFGGSGSYTYLNCGRSNRCCAIDTDEALVCNAAASLPANKPDGKVVSVAGTDMGFCAVFDTGRVYCWGEDGGTIGRGQGAPAEEFPVSGWTQVVLPGGATSTAGGQWHNCWLMADKTVYCAGESNDQAAGGGSGVPTQIKTADGNPISNIVAVNGAKDAACATNSTGELFCWAGAGGNGATAVKIDLGERKIRLPLDCQ